MYYCEEHVLSVTYHAAHSYTFVNQLLSLPALNDPEGQKLAIFLPQDRCVVSGSVLLFGLVDVSSGNNGGGVEG